MQAGNYHTQGALRPQFLHSTFRQRQGWSAMGRTALRRAGHQGEQRRQPQRPRASSSGFTEVKKEAEADYRRVRDLLPTLETALQTAAHARAPAEEADAAWQESHRKHSTLGEEVKGSLEALKGALVEAAGGEAWATAQLVEHHLRARMQRYRAQLEPAVWEEFEATSFVLPIPGAHLMAQVAAVELNGSCYAVVGVALRGPFLSNSVHSLLLHWATSRNGGKWEPPAKGWQTQPSMTQALGERAWQTHFAAYAPVLEGAPVEEATVHSIILQLPLGGALVAKGGGMPFVLKRTDGGSPEWVKKGGNHDFLLDLTPAIGHFARKAEEEAASSSLTPRSENWVHSWGLDTWDWGRTIASAGQGSPKGGAKGWLAHVSSWEEIMETPLPSPAPIQLLQRLRQVAKALAAYGAGDAPNGASKGGRALLQQCQAVEGNLKALDIAELAAHLAQKRKEQLHEVYTKAESTAAQLKQEISGSLDAARRMAVRLRGRNTEITQRDLEILAAQLAEEMSRREEERLRAEGGAQDNKARQLVFLQESVMRVAGIEGSVLVQTYLDGPKPPPAPAPPAGGLELPTEAAAAVDAALSAGSSSEEEEEEEAAAVGRNGAVAANGRAAPAAAPPPPPPPPPRPQFDSVLVSVVVAEDFPDRGFKVPLVLHWAGVPHEGGSWLQPPEGWTASGGDSRREGSATQTPLQRYTITLDGGDPVFVDPSLYGACLRLPLRGCKAAGTLGVEFVLKGRDGAWLLRQQPHGRTSNFFMDLPRLA